MDITPERARVDLDGLWRCEVIARTELRGDGSNHEQRTDLPDIDRLPVPSNWHVSGLPGLHGRVSLERDLPPVDGAGWWLCFGGVDYFCEVYLDDVLVLRHEGAFDPFQVPLPSGTRTLRLVVDAPSEELGTLWPYRKRQLKGIFTQWDPLELFEESTGGCWGPVWMERRPQVHVAELRSTTFLVPRPRIEGGAYVVGAEQDARLLVEVRAWSASATRTELVAEVCGVRAAREVDLPAGYSAHRLVLTIQDPVLWWPWDRGEPVLHELTVQLGEDELRRRIGLREFAFDEQTGTLACNGEPVTVRGSNIIPEKWLSLYNADRAAADLELVRRAGLNAVRVSVHIAAEEFYDACDAAGVLIWQDMPLQWDYLIDDEVIRQAAEQSERIVARLHDHPSIALWSAHNEPFPADRQNFAGPLLRAIRSVDGSRPLHAASDFGEHAYPGWFFGTVADYGLPPAMPYITEFGALALPSVAESERLGGRSWPPSGPDWSAVLPEQAPLFDIAQVPLGSSLTELVEASQRYQAQVVQTGVESYRSQGMNFFHFAFLDGWPAVTWSVVSYDRVPKLGYTALRKACQPVLIGASLSRRILSDAVDSKRFPLVAAVWVVNDTREAISGGHWQARLGGHEIGSGPIDVPADGIGRWDGGWQRWPEWSPPALPAGEYELELILTDSTGQRRSTNSYSITVVKRGLNVPMRGAAEVEEETTT